MFRCKCGAEYQIIEENGGSIICCKNRCDLKIKNDKKQ